MGDSGVLQADKKGEWAVGAVVFTATPMHRAY